jgi:pimeloyl-ACP methyl ester carboxylesterase
MDMRSGTIAAPGAELYYEMRGAGPALLLIPGGPADAGVFAGLAEALSDRFTTIAYDPRGNSRSALLGAPVDQNLDVHAQDAVALLSGLNFASASVFGTSGGAQIGLNLAARFPQRVETLVAHEPPCVRLAPDADQAIAFLNKVHDSYRQGGVEAAIKAFMAGAGLENSDVRGGGAPTALPPEMQETFARIGRNWPFFFEHGLKPIGFFMPDIAALRSGPTRIIVGLGAESAGNGAERATIALAERLETTPVTFPGDHGGYGAKPREFAEILSKVLGAGHSGVMSETG